MKVLIYARTSTITQSKNNTIESQIDILKEYCQLHKLDYELYQDNESGASQERIIRLIKYLQSNTNINKIVFTYFDRLARDVFLQLFLEKECKKLNIELISTEQDILNNPDDPFRNAMKQIVSVFSELEKNLITKRLSTGRTHKALKGNKSQGNCPFGYEYEGKGTKAKKVIVCNPEAEIIKQIFNFYKETNSPTKTAKRINETGARTRKGNQFSKQAINKIISNKFYTGILIYNGKEIKGNHTALISKNMYSRLNNA